MQVEVGKVYKCGDGYEYIDYQSQWLVSIGNDYSFIGIRCDERGRPGPAKVGKFSEDGDFSVLNPQQLCHQLQEIPKRETINIYGKTYYKDEYEKVEEAFQKALAGLNEVEKG